MKRNERNFLSIAWFCVLLKKFFNQIYEWKDFWIFLKKKIVFCLNSEYASEYRLKLIRFKSIIIRSFSFFHTTKTSETTDETVFNEIFWILSFFINEFNISFIAFLSLIDIEYEICFSFIMFFSFLKNMNILMSFVKRFNFDLNRILCFFNISFIFFRYSFFQCLLMFESIIAFTNFKSMTKKFFDSISSSICLFMKTSK